MEAEKSQRLNKEDWLVAALDVLSEDGIEKVKVEPLAVYLKVTKCSFYWHFKNHEALLTQMVDHWERIQNEIIDQIKQVINQVKR